MPRSPRQRPVRAPLPTSSSSAAPLLPPPTSSTPLLEHAFHVPSTVASSPSITGAHDVVDGRSTRRRRRRLFRRNLLRLSVVLG
jgi:hypothetical protein